MSDFEKIDQNLKTILKKGDVYDTISKKEGVLHPHFAFLKYNILLFSRLLYGLTFGLKKIKALTSPTTKVHNAQQEIREALGVNVDIIKNKEYDFKGTVLQTIIKMKALVWRPKKYLACYYENDTLTSESYLNNLIKIYHFAQNHSISKIYLKKNDLTNFTIDPKLPEKRLSDILNADFVPSLDKQLIELTPSSLGTLINSFHKTNLKLEFINYLTTQSKDIVITSAFHDFIQNNDFNRFLKLVHARLSARLNSESTKRDKEFAKIYDNILIAGEQVQVQSRKPNGDIIRNDIMTIYDYLDIPDYNSLVAKIQTKTDNLEELALCALYLYLVHNNKVIIKPNTNKESFYDYVYRKFISKQKGEITHIRGLRTKQYKFLNEFFSLSLTYVASMVIAIFGAIASETAESLWSFYNLNQEYNYISTVYENIVLAFNKSLEFERSLVTNATSSVHEFFTELAGEDNLSHTGDSTSNNASQVLANVNYYHPEIKPKYFATGYSYDGEYEKGSMTYEIVTPTISLADFGQGETVLSINYRLKKRELKNSLKNQILEIPLKYFPIDNNYEITNLFIIDAENTLNQLSVNYKRDTLELTDSECELLKSMKNPNVIINYGYAFTNAFANNLPNSDKSSSEIKEAIRRGLNMGPDATIEDMLIAISEKYYSTTPIKDAGLTRTIKHLDEETYFETIASLDSLICNLAASLATELNDELIYVVGYYSGDNKITGNEYHAWAMNQEGQLIEVTPYRDSPTKKDTSLNSLYKNILDFCYLNKIPVIVGLALFLLLTKKIYNKKVSPYLKITSLKHLLEREDASISYAKLNETLYGGLNLPVTYSPEELLNIIRTEYSEFTKEELQALKTELKKLQKRGGIVSKNTLKLAANIPDIIENAPELSRRLQK